MAKQKAEDIRRVGIIFSGGPAPGANAVISAAATSFLEDGRNVVGFFHGYSNLQDYEAKKNPLRADEHYRVFQERDLRGLRNQRGIVIGTARANPGKTVTKPDDLLDKEKTARLHNVYQALVDLDIDALISIGGDDTLKTANFIYEYQKRLPSGSRKVRVIHLPKTIDNDYEGIDFTFGYFTAVDVMAKELMNLRADAMSTGSYFIVEAMGRKAGWLAYGVAIAGEAHLVITSEDVSDDLCEDEEVVDEKTSKKRVARKLSLHALADKIVDLLITRESRKKYYGTVVLAEGLGELLADRFLAHVPKDEHGHRAIGQINFGKLVAATVAERYEKKTGRKKKLTGIQMGYESRCSPPHAFDVVLGSQLGIGAYRGLVEEGLDGHMVSVSGQFDLRYVPFHELVNPETLVTEVRFIKPGSDFHRMAHFLETRVDWEGDFSPGRRLERGSSPPAR